MKVFPSIAASLILGMLTVSPVMGQELEVSAGPGWMVPSGYYSSRDHSGWQIMGAAEIVFPRTAFGLRFDVMYGETAHRGAASVGSTRLNGGWADLVYSIPLSTGSLRPYVLAGVGYGLIDASRSEMGPSLAGGTGLSIGTGRTKMFGEARYITVGTSGSAMSFFPVTLGVSHGL
jgi:hypothetical protein